MPPDEVQDPTGWQMAVPGPIEQQHFGSPLHWFVAVQGHPLSSGGVVQVVAAPAGAVKAV